MSLSKTLNPLLSTGSTQEDRQLYLDMIVDLVVKHQDNQKLILLYSQR